MVVVLKKKILRCNLGMWQRYGEAFKKIWAASAFKGKMMLLRSCGSITRLNTHKANQIIVIK